ncbi:MAG: hypothetical protein WBB27_01185 [Maribacter sp.]
MNKNKKLEGSFLNTEWLKKVVFAVVVTSLLVTNAHSQELPKNLLYANENLKFEKLYILGDYKVLHFSDFYKQNNRFMYLMDEKNQVIDKMQIRNDDYILIRSDSTYAFKNLSDLGEVKVSEKGFQTTMFMDVSAVFSKDYFEPQYVLGRNIIGSKYHTENDCLTYQYALTDSIKFIAGDANSSSKLYNLNGSTNIYILDEEKYEKITNKKFAGLEINKLFDKDKSC